MNDKKPTTENVLEWRPSKVFDELEKVLRERISLIEKHTERYPSSKKTNHHRIHGVEDAIYALYNYCESHPNLQLFPVHIEQEVYRINEGAKEPIIPMTVIEIMQTILLERCPSIIIRTRDNHDHGTHSYYEEEFGKDVFFTREAAQKALAERLNMGEHEEVSR